MNTISITIQNLYAPCGCACRYCLLQSCKKAEGVDYYRGKKIAEKFVEWSKAGNFSSTPMYTIAYCAEYPELFDNIAFNRSTGAATGFLQGNGIAIRDKGQTDHFVARLKSAGINMIDITFFGNQEYHDIFAARKGDYQFMLQLADSAARAGIMCAPSLVITEESKDMLEELILILRKITDISHIHAFLPDYRGRGNLTEDVRLTRESYMALPDTVKDRIQGSRYKTEQEWLSEGELPDYTNRALIISLRKDNIALLESMSCDEMVAYVEGLDDAYYQTIPSIHELAHLYGDPANTRLYRPRDLFWKWQKRYIKQNHIDIYDVTDERFCCTVRS